MDAAKLWLTLAIVGGVVVLRVVLGQAARALMRGRAQSGLVFWTGQAVSLAALVCILVALVAIWVDDGVREIKDRMSRRILAELEAAGIAVAGTTMEITVMDRS